MVATAIPTPAAPPPGPPAPPTAVSDDPFEAADKAQWSSTFSVLGQVQVETWFCVLVKGQGKVPFDANQHDIGGRCTAIKIAILPAIPGRQNTERELIAESAEWTKIINPSIKALGPTWNLRALHNQWVEAQLVPSGRKYTSSDGIDKDATTIKFVRVFASEDACVAAAQAGRPGQPAAASAVASAAPAAAPGAPNDAEKATATKFLPALWRASGNDLEKFGELLAKNALTAKYFDLSSPEVLDVITPF